LHSYINDVHEQKLKKIIENEIPDVYLSISSELLPQFREYERLSTTVINAYIGPIVSRYIDNLERSLGDMGVKQLLIMSSSGGMITTEVAKKRPIETIESGPAAGVVAAAYVGKLIGRENIISLDMGGTTAKASLIFGGEPRVTYEYEVAPVEVGEHLIRGTGYPVRVPVTDLVEVGAGGGSIAWIDPGGALRVGPQSAGAYPGPVCYKMGGTEPTVTDANVVLRRINPDYFLGGEMKIDAKAAYEAIDEKIAKKLGMSVEEAAEGIISVSNSTMARAIRYVSVERGYDPRNFTLVAFGGAAPTQVCQLAEMVEIPEIVVPMVPGLFSALGMLMADLRHDYVKTRVISEDQLNASILNELYEELEGKGRDQLQREGVPPEDMKFIRSADMRYAKQGYELNVPIPGGTLQEGDIPMIIKRFHEAHERMYGFSMPTEKTMLINIRLTAIGVKMKPKMKVQPKGPKSPDKALKGVREVYFPREGWIKCAIYDRDKLVHGNVIEGPAVIEEADSTIVVFPNYEAYVDGYGNVIMRRR
jgi:N-methylhydantoinase A